MRLITKELETRFKEIGSQKTVSDPLVIAKFFNPIGVGTWYATEYLSQEKLFFGYVSILGDWNDEWGYFSLIELQEYNGSFGVGIERDLHCGEFPISQVLDKKTNNCCGCV